VKEKQHRHRVNKVIMHFKRQWFGKQTEGYSFDSPEFGDAETGDGIHQYNNQQYPADYLLK
jgi:hypothetical protein